MYLLGIESSIVFIWLGYNRIGLVILWLYSYVTKFVSSGILMTHKNHGNN